MNEGKVSATYICNDCESIWLIDDKCMICPCCHSTNIIPKSTYDKYAGNLPKPEEIKDHIIFYNNYGFMVMHSDSHFYSHTPGNISELLDPKNKVRFYTKQGAINAIAKMTEAKPEWKLQMKKII